MRIDAPCVVCEPQYSSRTVAPTPVSMRPCVVANTKPASGSLGTTTPSLPSLSDAVAFHRPDTGSRVPTPRGMNASRDTNPNPPCPAVDRLRPAASRASMTPSLPAARWVGARESFRGKWMNSDGSRKAASPAEGGRVTSAGW
jgi:hypothetical protein